MQTFYLKNHFKYTLNLLPLQKINGFQSLAYAFSFEWVIYRPCVSVSSLLGFLEKAQACTFLWRLNCKWTDLASASKYAECVTGTRLSPLLSSSHHALPIYFWPSWTPEAFEFILSKHCTLCHNENSDVKLYKSHFHS